MLANVFRTRKVINTCLKSTGIIFDSKMNEDSSSNDFEHLMSKVYSYLYRFLILFYRTIQFLHN